MLTIKHQTPYGAEALYEATNVQFCPVEGARLDQPVGTSTSKLGAFYFRRPDHSEHTLEELDDGMIYVMNDNGSTVGKYDLGGWLVGTTNGGNVASVPASA